MIKYGSKTIIFDFDGTLVDSSPGIIAGLAVTLERHGISPCRSLNSNIIGPPLRDTLREVSGSTDDRMIEALASTFLEYYDAIGYLDTVPYPGAAEALQRFRNLGARIYLATNKRSKPTRLILDHFGWTEFFNDILCLDSCTPSVPDKRALLSHLLRKHQLATKTAVYIGDTPADAEAAAANNIRFVCASWGYGDWADAKPDHVSTKAVTLPAVIERIFDSRPTSRE